jgi:hypothetical protein
MITEYMNKENLPRSRSRFSECLRRYDPNVFKALVAKGRFSDEEQPPYQILSLFTNFHKYSTYEQDPKKALLREEGITEQYLDDLEKELSAEAVHLKPKN